ncbi:MAG: GntR family transcriptional regulator [Planctomycetota bacterium]
MTAATSQIYGQIRDRLVQGKLRVGEKVSEQSLAGELGVSRTPVREAIKRLQTEGYLEQVHRSGTIVREPSIDEVAEAYDLRIALEPYALKTAPAEKISDALPGLTRLCEQLKALAPKVVDPINEKARNEIAQMFFDCDRSFHKLLLVCSGNRRFASLVESARLFAQIHGVSRHSIITFEIIMGVYHHHAEIVDHLRDRRFDLAGEALARHIRMSKLGAIDWMTFHREQKKPG